MTNEDCFCTYCGIVCDTMDHVVPQHLLRRAGELGLDLSVVFRMQRWEVPSCRECNSAIGGKVFPNLAERRAFAHAHIRRKYASFLRIPAWDEEELSEMGPRAQGEIQWAIEIRDWVRGRLAWRGAQKIEGLESVFALSKDVSRASG